MKRQLRSRSGQEERDVHVHASMTRIECRKTDERAASAEVVLKSNPRIATAYV